MTTQKSSRGRKPRFTREQVLETALDLVDREGPSALSMRRVAAELGIEAMSLYTYVSSKAELLDGLSELLVADVLGDDTPDDWRGVVEAFCRGWRDAAARHPQAALLAGMRPLRTRAALEIPERLLAALRGAGLSRDQALAGARLATAFTRGYALADIAGFTAVGVPPEEIPRDLVQLRELAEHPSALDPDAAFERSLAILVAGLAATIGA